MLVDTCTDREEGTTLFINPQSHSGTSSVRRRYIEQSNHTASLNCTTLARILHETNTPHVDFLSLDAEGAEMDGAVDPLPGRSTRALPSSRTRRGEVGSACACV